MKVALIVQARMHSTRLPGKVLMEIGGRPMLALHLERLAGCAMDEIILATTHNSDDDVLVDLARKYGVRWFRGSEDDVLGRYVGAAREAKADIVVRTTGDCPLIDPHVANKVIQMLAQNAGDCDYASNVLKRTFPRGLDVEAFFWDVLLRMDRFARTPEAREHVTLGLRTEHSRLYKCRSVEDAQDYSDLSWTVDTLTDLHLVRALVEGLGNPLAGYGEFLTYACSHAGCTMRDSAVPPAITEGSRVRYRG